MLLFVLKYFISNISNRLRRRIYIVRCTWRGKTRGGRERFAHMMKLVVSIKYCILMLQVSLSALCSFAELKCQPTQECFALVHNLIGWLQFLNNLAYY